MLEPGLQAEILRLYYGEQLSRRQIAGQLGINRKTVAAVIQRGRVITQMRQRRPRASILEPHHALIDRLLEDAPARSAVNILQRLRDAGYRGGITILRDRLREIRPTAPREAFFELDFAPGEAAQVDWGGCGLAQLAAGDRREVGSCLSSIPGDHPGRPTLPAPGDQRAALPGHGLRL